MAIEQLSDWLASLFFEATSTAALIVVLWFLFRNLIEKRLAASVELESDKLLATFRGEIDKTAEQLVSVTRAGIDARAAHTAAVAPMVVIALERLWTCVLEWQKATALVFITQAMSEDYVTRYGDDDGTKQFFRQMLDSIDHMELLRSTGKGELSRPFVRETTWAPYYAFHLIHVNTIARASMAMIQGSEAAELWSPNIDRTLIESASTPELLATYDENQILGTTKFVAYVKEQVLREIRSELSGEETAPDAQQTAVEIIRRTEELLLNPTPTVRPPAPLSGV